MSEQIFEKVCTKCEGDPQPLENYHRDKTKRDGRTNVCKDCCKTISRAYYLANQEALKAKTKAWHEANPERSLAKSLAWQKANPERKNANGRRWKIKTGYDTSEHAQRLSRERRARQRKEVIEVYGNECSCCGSKVIEFLCFDHVGGWGAEHRKTVKSTQLPGWLKKHNYPRGDGTICTDCGVAHQGIRLLCYSCNMAVAASVDGICTHQRVGPEDLSGLSDHQRYDRERALRFRDEAFLAYGGKCACPGCDETDYAFLSIEHVGGWGKTHRAELGQVRVLRWLKKNGYPKDGFTVTCFNCNMSAGKSESGECPHSQGLAIAA